MVGSFLQVFWRYQDIADRKSGVLSFVVVLYFIVRQSDAGANKSFQFVLGNLIAYVALEFFHVAVALGHTLFVPFKTNKLPGGI